MVKEVILNLIRNIEDEDSRKTFLIYTFGTIGVVTSLFFSIDGYIQNRSIYYMISLISLFSIQTANLIYFGIKKHVSLGANVLILTFFVFLIALFGFVGVAYSGMIWFFVLSPLAILCTDIKQGLTYNIAIYVIAIFFISNPYDLNVIVYPKELTLRFLIAFPIVNVFILMFEYARKRSFDAYLRTLHQVNSKNDELLAAQEQLRLSNEQLSKLNQTKDKFFSLIAHDLRSPFTTILALSELLADDDVIQNEDKKKQMLSHIRESSKSAHTLMENLFTWALSQSGGISFAPEKTNLKSMVSDVLVLAEGIANAKEIELVNQVTQDSFVSVDVNMIHTVLRNLIFNALKFTKRQGKITVSIQPVDQNNFVHVQVRDTGVGMDQHQIDELFRLDLNSSTTGTEKEKGTGLGLIICKEFIEKHKGQLVITSDVGEGSTFMFSVPARAI